MSSWSNLGVDPGFVDAAGGDFHLQPTSPCVDVGVASPEVFDDAAGVARPQGVANELGAFELVP